MKGTPICSAQQYARIVNLARRSLGMSALLFPRVSITKHLSCIHMLQVLLLTFPVFIITNAIIHMKCLFFKLNVLFITYKCSYSLPLISIVL